MVRRNIERFKVVVIVLDFRTHGNVITDTAEQPLDTFQRECYRMQTTTRLPTAGQGHIDTFSGQLRLKRGGIQRLASGINLIRQGLLGLVDTLTSSRTLLCRQLAQALELGGNLTLLTKIAHPQLFERRNTLGGLNGLTGLSDQCR